MDFFWYIDEDIDIFGGRLHSVFLPNIFLKFTEIASEQNGYCGRHPEGTTVTADVFPARFEIANPIPSATFHQEIAKDSARIKRPFSAILLLNVVFIS